MDNSIGIIKEFDSLGRIVIPKEYRKLLKMDNSRVEIVLTKDGILIRNPKYTLVRVEKDNA